MRRGGVKVLCHPFDRNETTGIPPSSADADTSPRGQNLCVRQNLCIEPRIKFSPTGGVPSKTGGGYKKSPRGKRSWALAFLLRPRETL